MLSLNEHTAATETVARFFGHLQTGSIELALRCWTPGAIWHVTGRSTRARDYSPTEYLTMCAEWKATYPRYQCNFSVLNGTGELAFFTIRSQHGEAPGETAGMMIYRVVDGRITEGWAIPAKHGDTYTF